jgi:hypothetical protein
MTLDDLAADVEPQAKAHAVAARLDARHAVTPLPHAALPFLAKPFTLEQLLGAIEQASERLSRGGVTHL